MAILFSGKVRDFQALLAALAYAYPRDYKVANFVERPLAGFQVPAWATRLAGVERNA